MVQVQLKKKKKKKKSKPRIKSFKISCDNALESILFHFLLLLY